MGVVVGQIIAEEMTIISPDDPIVHGMAEHGGYFNRAWKVSSFDTLKRER